jgi:hypothetical protein
MQHMNLCIGPRIRRRDQKLNERLVPLLAAIKLSAEA